jgi:RimJ/RimL family protein N-acetyltransferase
MMSSKPPAQDRSPRLAFVPYNERFLEKSWQWLNDPEIKRLTMTPDFTREGQRQWFARLPERTDYRIWGVLDDGTPIGAVGLKHLTATDAEYWGYIGEPRYWGAGRGSRMVAFVIDQARALKLGEIYLYVDRENARAVRLYERSGFLTVSEDGGVLLMRLDLKERA